MPFEMQKDIMYFRLSEENSEGVPVPVSAELTGTPSRELSRWIEAELGIPVERQVWLDEN